MKTIKQIADELEVSKTAVRKKIDRLGLREKLQKNGNQFAIDKRQEKLIKSAFQGVEPETENGNQSETVSTLVSMLQKELTSKNEQIAQLQTLVSQEQQLRMVTEQRLLQIEEQHEDPVPAPKKKWWKFWGNDHVG